MDETDILPPLPPRRRPIGARRLPGPPPAFWMVLGLLVVLGGFWMLRPRGGVTGVSAQGGRVAAATRTPPGGPPPTSAPRPALQPIKPVTTAVAPVPTSETQAVRPSLTSVNPSPDEELTANPESYTVVAGDTLGNIAARFGVPTDQLMAINNLTDPNLLHVGQVLLLPRTVALAAPFQRILPDSEVVFSPAYSGWDLAAWVEEQDGFLASYKEEAEGETLTGVQIVERVSQRYSVGPRPLLALLEYRSGWVTEREPTERAYPLGVREPVRSGLFYQLSWAANRLNQGFYGKVSGRDQELHFKDGTRALFDSETNPGTTAVQNLFAVQGTPDSWSADLADDGFLATYRALFGDPWDAAVEPLIPDDLEQPELALPWDAAETWYFTGGPHGGWGDFSGWAALDFVPTDHTGCAPSEFWVKAAAPGRVVRSENGEVVVDSDGDGFLGTGWTIFYMHVASAGRATVGTEVQRGDPIGRPSCEGGVSDAAHLHIARRFNGQWIEADGPLPFVLGGWEAERTPRSYDGFLRQNSEEREACACREEGLNDIRPMLLDEEAVPLDE